MLTARIAAAVLTVVAGTGVTAATCASASNGPTTVSFTVVSGPLSVTSPSGASLARLGALSASAGAHWRGPLGAVKVTDRREDPGTGWTATVTSSGRHGHGEPAVVTWSVA
jgi:hypothetical protein